MMQTLWAVIHGGKIELAEPVDLPEGAKVLVTLLSEDETRFWTDASQKSLAAIWDNAEDDAYAQLLKE
jgi:predicted DNA-binding antitoxin AbrB/MazE fold protein